MDHIMDKIVILSGAGLSAQSGISTFRDKNMISKKFVCLVV